MLNIDKFLEYLRCELNRSQKTIDSYCEDLKLFEEYTRNLSGFFCWESVDSDMIRNWMEHMVDEGNSPASVNRRLSAIKMFYRFALVRKFVDSDPVHSIKGPKRSKQLPQFLKEKQVDKLLDGQSWDEDYKSVRARTIIMLFYETGMRLSELVNLDDCDVNFIRREISVTGKGDKQRIVPFGDELEKILRDYIALREESVKSHSEALILSEKGKRMSSESVRRIVKENLSRVCSLKKKSPHVLRHTFATAMMNHRVDIESLKRLLGHAKLSTTEIYTHTTFEQLKRVYNEAHPRA